MTELSQTAHDVRIGVVALARRLGAERQDHPVSALGVAVLARLNREGPRTPGQLAEAERVSPQTLTRVLAGLGARSLLVRQPHPGDGRQALLDISDEGLELVLRDAACREEWLADALATALTPAEQQIVRVAAGLMLRVASVSDSSRVGIGQDGS